MKNLMQVFKITIISISMLVLIGAGNAHATLIDNFNTDQLLSTTTSASSTDYSGSGYIGDSRDVSVTATSSTVIPVYFGPTGGELYLANPSSSGSTASVLWDDWSGGADLTDGGMDDRFVINVISIDSTITLGMTVTEGSNTASYSTSTPTTGDLEFLYANFTGDAVDWENIDSVELWLSGPASADMQLDFIETGSGIPEPSTMLLLSAGLIGLVAVNIKKIKI